ncbi:MAG TPA: DUF5681 domain-containing protein [Terriglobales bacterium]
MSKDEIKNTVAPAADEGKAGYKRPPVKSRFPKGKSGNPFGRKKGQRNMATVLNEVLQQTVTVKQGDKSERLTKGEAAIKVIMNKANNGDRRAIEAVSYLAEKIGRIEDKNSETRQAGGVMLVPGVAASLEEWKAAAAKKVRDQEERDRLRKEQARTFRKWEAEYLAIINENKGTPLGDFAVTRLAEFKNTDEYRTNYFLHWHPPEEEIAVDPPKEEPPAKLPWDADEYVRMPFYARAEYARTHSEDVKPKPQPELAPHPVYRRLKNSKIWSSVPWSQLPADDPRLRDEPLSDGRYGK